MRIREACWEDMGEIVRVANQSFLEWARYTSYIGKKFLEKIHRFPEWQFVAEENGVIVGFVINEPVEKGIKISWIAVLPSYQGKGIGGELLRKVEEKCKSLGLKDIHVGTPFALSFYQKYGFELVKVTYRLIKEIVGKVIPSPHTYFNPGLEDIRELTPLLGEEIHPFLEAFFDTFPEEQEKIVGIRRGNVWEALAVGKTNPFSQELVETRFLWGENKWEALRVLEYISSVQGRRWVGVETESEEEKQALERQGYTKVEKNPLYWTLYHLIKKL